jgi:hypothetical protein
LNATCQFVRAPARKRTASSEYGKKTAKPRTPASRVRTGARDSAIATARASARARAPSAIARALESQNAGD